MFDLSTVEVGSAGIGCLRVVHSFSISTYRGGKIFFNRLKFGHEIGTLAQSQAARFIRIILGKFIDQIHRILRLAPTSFHESWTLIPLLILVWRHFDLDKLSFEKLIRRIDLY
jgi:hypothetical protein